ncbi:GNAT family N-acetyltransferase [Nonomuraea sp. SBT364]|uniref:GNAT family N-acetyltransferase n=1 Tax=Nonomuraea sp. SBT364 TaxID=1580530 RepID=UPI00066C5297|nr:GNAT family N-acetyltransferase [Nonomuraea sp. SBT364]
MTGAIKTTQIDTVRAWVDGWVISRDTPPPVTEPWGYRVDVGLPGHLARHIVPAPTPALIRHLTGTITAPGTWLKLCAPAELIAPWLPSGWAIDPPEYMMTARLPAEPAVAVVPPGYTAAVTTRAGVTVARLLTAAGEMAARGQLAVTGTMAVVDRVETASGHRRRGLGSVVMRTLTAAAHEVGATGGVLVATPEGRALYESLGWRLHSPMTAAVLRSASG